MKDVCQFIPVGDEGNIVYYHFVYENGLRNLQQPFSHFHYRVILVAKGEGVLNFVFFLRYTTFDDLPEDTSLQRALKARYLAGERLYEYGGVIPFGDEPRAESGETV